MGLRSALFTLGACLLPCLVASALAKPPEPVTVARSQNCLVSCSVEAINIRHELAQIRQDIEAALRSRIERDIAKGLLPPDCDAEMLAGHVFAMVQGMSTLAKDGAGRKKLLGIVERAMAGWPHSK